MGTILQDARYAIRTMRHAPGFTAVATLALALGIGANTAIFSIVYGVALKPLPFPDSSRLAAVRTLIKGNLSDTQSVPDVEDFGAQATTVTALAAYATGAMGVSDGRESQMVPAAFVTGDFFPVFAVPPIRGRAFTAADAAKGAPRTVVVSDAFWARRFNRDDAAVGKTLRLDGSMHTIVGVMPPAFDFPIQNEAVQLWVPMRTLPFLATMADQRGAHLATTVARLKPDASIAAAQADLNAIAARLAQEYPRSNAGRTVILESLPRRLVGDFAVAFSVLIGAVVFVLLIACANVANLLLARGASRQREIAVRLALGATRGRLVSQLLTESVLLGTIGGGLGLLLAVWTVAAITNAVPIEIPRLRQVSIEPVVLAFTAVVSMLTGILFGLVPALQSSRPRVNDTLKDTARSSGGSRMTRTRSLLVVSEVALALMLLIGAGLLMRSFVELRRVDPGFATDRLLTVELPLSVSRYSSDDKLLSFYTAVLDRIRTIPGVQSSGVATMLPMTGSNFIINFAIDGRPAPDPVDRPMAHYYGVSPEFLQTIRVPVLGGRLFTEQDAASPKPTAAVISQAVAKKYWPDSDPLGQRITIGDAGVPREIIGVVGDIKNQSLDERTSEQIYVLYPQRPWPFMSVAVRTTGDPLSVAQTLRARLHEVDRELALEKMTTMEEYVARSVAEPRFNSLLLGAFAALALVLSALGIYGVMAYSVTQRTREIGIRIALGAQPAVVLRLIVSQGMRTAAAGIVIGLIGAAALSRWLDSLVFGIGVRDVWTFSAVAALLALIAFAACYVPARRAMRIDPTVALRTE